MPKVSVAGVAVDYVERGPGEADWTLVLLHGFTPDHRLMTGAFEPVFARRDRWRRIYLDLPGMGLTKAPGHVGSTDDVYEVVREVVEKLVPGPYAVAGESYGGYLARGLVAEHAQRVTGMALVCPMIVAARHRVRQHDSGVDEAHAPPGAGRDSGRSRSGGRGP